MSAENSITKSSGNIFKDLGLEHPEELHAKATLLSHVLEAIRAKGLTDSEAAERLGVSEADVAALEEGEIDRFGMEQLFRFLGQLGLRAEISVAENAAPYGECL